MFFTLIALLSSKRFVKASATKHAGNAKRAKVVNIVPMHASLQLKCGLAIIAKDDSKISSENLANRIM